MSKEKNTELTEVEELELEIGGLLNEIDNLEKESVASNKEISSLEDEIQDLEDDKEILEEQIRELEENDLDITSSERIVLEILFKNNIVIDNIRDQMKIEELVRLFTENSLEKLQELK